MGAVFEAVDERLDTTVALKETLFADERLRKQFEREARLLARMHHPALPRVSDHFSEGDGQFLVMQFIAGEDFAEMITRRNAPFPVAQVLSWADQLLDALDYLHTQDPQIIHRDIKPQNLKQTARGQIILLDFGLAKGQASEVSRATTSVSIFGYTPNYAPLEQIQGLGTDQRSDLYALSATLYHLLTATKPPDALSRAAALVNGQPDPLVPATELNTAISADTASVLSKAMAQNREQRYSTALAMRRALQGVDEAVTVSSRGEANTVLFPQPAVAAPTGASTTQVNSNQPTVHAANQDTIHVVDQAANVHAGETTVVRPPAVLKKGAPGWLWPVAALVLLLVGAGAFYALRQQNSNSITAPAPAAQQSPAGAPTLSEPPAAGKQTAAAENQPEGGNQSVNVAGRTATGKGQAASPKEKAANSKEAAKQPAKVAAEHPNVPAQPSPPEADEAFVPVPAPGQPGQRRGGANVRRFPDGRQVVIAPDGTRIITYPDGSQQIIRPGQRPNPRRRRAIP
jgi:hypothetical protein